MVAEGIPSYDELKLRIGQGAGGTYQVVAFGPDGSTASGSFELPFDETQLDNFVLRVGRPRRGVRAYRSSQMEDAKLFGSQLFDALLAGAVHDVYLRARQATDQKPDRGLRVTLYLTDVPELMEVPWEFLYDRPAFLSQSIYTPVVRSLDLKTVRPPRKLTLPLRVLGMVSGPRGFETLEVGREKDKLAEALNPLERDGKVELRWLERATLSALDDAISAPGEVHVLHYIGHGAYDRRTEGGILVLENAHGDPHEVTGEELGSLLQDERSLRLVVLNSCEGARGSHVDPFSGVASSLVECGIPAVVGMQFEITDEAAITFGGRLYSALAQGFPIDAALAQSRKAIFAAGNDIEFGTPVLFLRAADARLFDPEQSPKATPERADEPDVSGAHPGAAAITAANGTVHSEPPAIADSGSAGPQTVASGRAQADSDRRDTTQAGHGRKAGPPSRPRPPRRFARPWMMVLAGGVLAAVVLVLLISGSGSHHHAATASAAATTVHPAAQWRPLQPLDKPVTAAGVAAYQNEIWVVGGTRDSNHDAIKDVWVLDPRSRSGWRPGPSLLEARAHAAVVANGQQLYVIGGFGPGGRATNTVFRLDGPTQQWRRDDRSLPDLRTSGAAAFDGTRIVFAGGNLDEEPMRDVWALDEQSWKSIGMLQTGRDQLAAAGKSGNVWFIGGGSGMSGAAYRQVDVAHGAHVDPFTPLNEGVRRPAAVSIGSGFCAIGGHLQGLARSGASGRVQCQGIHGSVPSMPPRVDSGATVLDDTIYVVGGQDPTHPFGTTTVQALDLHSAR